MSKEAMKLALEALEFDSHYGTGKQEAITALREAQAEQPAQQHVSVTDELVGVYCKAWEKSFTADNPYHTVSMTAEDRKHIKAGLKAALAEQPAAQQEPVLVVEVEPDYMSGGHHHKGSKPYISLKKLWRIPIGTELYTSPAQRKPLTDEEIICTLRPNVWAHVEGASREWMLADARAIEAAHGIKEKNT